MDGEEVGASFGGGGVGNTVTAATNHICESAPALRDHLCKEPHSADGR